MNSSILKLFLLRFFADGLRFQLGHLASQNIGFKDSWVQELKHFYFSLDPSNP
jgi:hypothetical protein